MTFVDVINVCEVPWWIGCGIYVFAKSLRAKPRHRRRGMLAAVTLVLFGFSDVVELQTGAWWHPWWLLLWKTACIAILVTCAVIHLRGRATAIPPVGETNQS